MTSTSPATSGLTEVQRRALPLAPKVVLHDHLDGGLRAATLVELADEIGHELPEAEPDALAAWVLRAADSGSLEAFLEPFTHVSAVLQTPHALTRVAREAVLDFAADGVVYAETRFAPEQSTAGGLSMTEVVDAVLAGVREGTAVAAQDGRAIEVGVIVCGMRQASRTLEAARVALERRDAGVVGYDIAGPEIGFPASDHAEAFALLRAELFPFTIHAGEAVGPESVAHALALGTQRIGHGVRVLEDVDRTGERPRFGRVASFVRDRRVPLEVCPRSNTQTGAAPSIAGHQVSALRDLGFAVTLSCDDRLWTGTSLTDEMLLLADEAGWTWDDFAAVTATSLDAAFLPADEREVLRTRVVTPGWAPPS